jgi:hypothetical protein
MKDHPKTFAIFTRRIANHEKYVDFHFLSFPRSISSQLTQLDLRPESYQPITPQTGALLISALTPASVKGYKASPPL